MVRRKNDDLPTTSAMLMRSKKKNSASSLSLSSSSPILKLHRIVRRRNFFLLMTMILFQSPTSQAFHQNSRMQLRSMIPTAVRRDGIISSSSIIKASIVADVEQDDNNSSIGTITSRRRQENKKKTPTSIPTTTTIIIPKERKHQLNAVRNKSWEDKYLQLVEFKKRHGHVNVPQVRNKKEVTTRLDAYSLSNDGNTNNDSIVELSIFCRNLRNQYKLLQNPETRHRSFLTKDRIERLEALGFQWNRHDAIWYQRYNELVQFFEIHHHSNVPTTTAATTATTSSQDVNPDLSIWVSHQRLRYKGRKVGRKPLTQIQLDLLAKVDFRWSPKDRKWWDNYAQLKAFKEQHGHMKLTCPKLRNWKTYVRSRCREYVMAVSMEGSAEGVQVSGLDRERLDALDDIDFCWLPKDDTTTNLLQPPEDIFAGYQ